MLGRASYLVYDFHPVPIQGQEPLAQRSMRNTWLSYEKRAEHVETIDFMRKNMHDIKDSVCFLHCFYWGEFKFGKFLAIFFRL